ncbi:MAG: M1 family metallopeptidase [Flavobacteriales bacterium]|nr:M1 family metallopeptidase [Flavobacteriales bacterium]
MRYLCLFYLSLISLGLYSQEFTYSDSLRGNLSSFRSCYDVIFYDLELTIDDENQSIIDSYNDIYIEAIYDFQTLQIDLFSSLNIQSIEFNNNELTYIREFNAVFIDFPRMINKGELIKFRVYYDGKPRAAVNPPWDGGFSWDFDENETPWIGVSCQGLGASSWWPCKDHQSDEPDSMKITCSVRHPLNVISNGNIISDTIIYNLSLDDMSSKRTWFVSYPINTYNVTLCIGDYVHFSDSYIDDNDTLDLDYYVLSYNKDKAVRHFQQVKPMLSCFEYYFGRYPFWDDGYALVETPYLGMEHQSAIAYGNNYLPGYNGNRGFISGLDFDYIIVHETGHEWWGNSITTNDIADMWVHEGFCTYSEVLYVECIYGYTQMLEYVKNQKKSVRNDKPIVGPFNVNKRGSNDMYQKASLMLHTLRNIINNDTLWFSIIKGISEDFKYDIIDGIYIINYINSKTDIDLLMFFNQYLYNKDLPVFEYKIQKNGREHTILYRWNAIDKFNMRLLINNGVDDIWLYPNSNWQELSLGNSDIKAFNVRDDLFFIDVKKIK